MRRSGAVAFAALASLSCHHRERLTIQYAPSAPPPPAFRTAIYVQVLDQRPPDRGGLDSSRVGWTPGNFGIPRRMRVPADMVARNVWSATADALAQVGIGPSTGPNQLVTTVQEFWEDGVGGTGTHVVVRYDLTDASGRVRWTDTVHGGNGEPPDPTTPPTPGVDLAGIDIFTRALADVSWRARARFASAPFQQALAR
jgi:hypothetical protein